MMWGTTAGRSDSYSGGPDVCSGDMGKARHGLGRSHPLDVNAIPLDSNTRALVVIPTISRRTTLWNSISWRQMSTSMGDQGSQVRADRDLECTCPMLLTQAAATGWERSLWTT
jgi:hypothetical protein